MSYTLTQVMGRGETLPALGTVAPTVEADLFKPELEGLEVEDEDKDYSQLSQPKLSIESVKLKLVRNMLNTNLLPGQTVPIDKTKPGRTTTAVAGADVEYAVVVDPFLPAAGVAPGALFWGVFSGPTTAIAAGAITAGANIGTAASGKVDDAAATGRLGFAIGSAAADGDRPRVYLRPRFR